MSVLSIAEVRARLTPTPKTVPTETECEAFVRAAFPNGISFHLALSTEFREHMLALAGHALKQIEEARRGR